MRQLRDNVWQRHGTSWLWDGEALAQVAQAGEVWSLRQFLRAAGKWPEDLPSNKGAALVVAGLDASLDLLSPDEAEKWLAEDIKHGVLSFQDFWESNAALVFWLPGAAGRIVVNPATDAVSWRCAAPHSNARVEFGRVLWGAANDYPQEILLREGAKPAGLFHLRIT